MSTDASILSSASMALSTSSLDSSVLQVVATMAAATAPGTDLVAVAQPGGTVTGVAEPAAGIPPGTAIVRQDSPIQAFPFEGADVQGASQASSWENLSIRSRPPHRISIASPRGANLKQSRAASAGQTAKDRAYVAEIFELRRQLSLSQQQVTHIVGVAQTNENAWEHEQAIRKHQVALSQSQVTHVSQVATQKMEQLKIEELKAAQYYEEARRSFALAEEKEGIIQAQRIELEQIREQAKAFCMTSSDIQQKLVSELQEAARRIHATEGNLQMEANRHRELQLCATNSDEKVRYSEEYIQQVEHVLQVRSQGQAQTEMAAQEMCAQMAQMNRFMEVGEERFQGVLSELMASKSMTLQANARVEQLNSELNMALLSSRDTSYTIEVPEGYVPEEAVNQLIEGYREQLGEKDIAIQKLKRIAVDVQVQGQSLLQTTAEQKEEIENMNYDMGRIVREAQEEIKLLKDQIVKQTAGIPLGTVEPVVIKLPFALPVEVPAPPPPWKPPVDASPLEEPDGKPKAKTASGVDWDKWVRDRLGSSAPVTAEDKTTPILTLEQLSSDASALRIGRAADDGTDTRTIVDTATITERLISSSRRPKQVNAPKFPSISTITTWLTKLSKNLVAASVIDDRKEVAWLMEVKEKTFDDLADSGEDRFAALDSLMIGSLEKTLPADLARTYNEKSEEALKNNDILMGRQLVWMILNYFKTANYLSMVYSFDTLMEITWYGDARVSEFRHQWNRIVDNMQERLDDRALRDILYKKMEKSALFAADLAHYRREKAKSMTTEGAKEDYSLTFLKGCMDRHIMEQLEEKQVAARKAGVRLGKTGNPEVEDTTPATPAKGGGKGAPKPKPKSKQAKAKGTSTGTASERRPSVGSQHSEGRGRAETPKGLCYYYNAGLRGGKACRRGDKCTWVHGRMSDEEFKRTPEPKSSRTNSPAPKKKAEPGRTWRLAKDGRKIPICCMEFKNTGKCVKKDKGTCTWERHITKEVYDKEQKVLDAGQS